MMRLALTAAAAAAASAAPCPPGSLRLQQPAGAYLCVSSSSGDVVALGDASTVVSLSARTELALPALASATRSVEAAAGTITVVKDWAGGGRAATTTDVFSLGGVGGSLRWDVAVASPQAAAFAVWVDTVMTFNSSFTDFWLAANWPAVTNATDPLAWRPLPTAPSTWSYGGAVMTWAEARETNSTDRFPSCCGHGAADPTPGYSVPLVALRAAGRARAFAYVGDVEDMTTFQNTTLRPQPLAAALRRYMVRTGGGSAPLAFGGDLLLLAGDDWRPALGFAVEAYPATFARVPGVNYSALEGLVAYADYRGGPLNMSHYQAAGLQLNWDATFPFNNHGDYLPEPALPGGSWFWACAPFHALPGMNASSCTNLTHAEVARWYADFAAAGFATAYYSTLNQYGLYISNPGAPVPKNCTDPPPDPAVDALLAATCATNAAVHGGALSGAAIRDVLAPDTAFVFNGAGGAVGMDPGDPAWLAHLLKDMARRLDLTPAQALCVDRGDWLGVLNPARDDGRSWFRGAPAASVLVTTIAASRAVVGLMHARGLPGLINDHAYRADVVAAYDGIYDEFGDTDARRSADAWLCAGGRVCSAWNHVGPPNKATWDSYLQSHLYLGIFPMIDFPFNDHSIQNGTGAAAFDAYGPLFRALRGERTMELRARPVAVLNASSAGGRPSRWLPRANVFRVGSSRAVVALVAGDAGAAQGVVAFELAHPPAAAPRGRPAALAAVAYVPGGPPGGEPARVAQAGPGAPIIVSAPMGSGCVVVVVDSV
jgi:hypothetical protein